MSFSRVGERLQVRTFATSSCFVGLSKETWPKMSIGSGLVPHFWEGLSSMELDLLFGNSLQPGELGAPEKNGAHQPGTQAPREGVQRTRRTFSAAP